MIEPTIQAYFQMAGLVVGAGVTLGVWRSYLPFDSFIWLLAIGTAGAVVAQYFPAWMPLMIFVMIGYGMLCLAVARNVLREERAVMARLRR
mgnify:CR=1 FL=1|nr:hypothetical protein [uncultured Acidocella sp.]